MGKSRTAPDLFLLVSTLAILCIGVVMVYSASAVLSYHEFGDWYYYLKRQLLFAALGVAAMLFMMNVDYWVWKKIR